VSPPAGSGRHPAFLTWPAVCSGPRWSRNPGSARCRWTRGGGCTPTRTSRPAGPRPSSAACWSTTCPICFAGTENGPPWPESPARTRAAGCAGRTPRSTTTWCRPGWNCPAGRCCRTISGRLTGCWPSSTSPSHRPPGRPSPERAGTWTAAVAPTGWDAAGTAGSRPCPHGRPGCCAARWPRTVSGTRARRVTCRAVCCAGLSRSSSRWWTGGGCSRPSCAGRWPTRWARLITPTGGRPGGPPCPVPWCCPHCGGRCPRWRWSATPRAA
jgi:hypothetical protein